MSLKLVPPSANIYYYYKYFKENAFFETGIKEINIRTNAVVDVITLYLMIFGLLFGDIKKEGFIPPIVDRMSIIFFDYYKMALGCKRGS